MNERLLQYIWQFQHYNKCDLRTTMGEELTVIHQGNYNTHQGPDFNEGRVRIGKNMWIGNIELHVNSSDWYRHSHSSDPNYENIILHVVWCDDRIDGGPNNIPTLVLQDRVAKVLLNSYDVLMSTQTFISCEASIASVNDLIWVKWKERLLIERLQRRCDQVLEMLAGNNLHWEEVLWWMLAKSFGLHVNTESFYEMAKSVSYNVLLKHRSQIHQVEALLFGQSGLLENTFREKYAQMLAKEYEFLRCKYDLKKINVRMKFLRMRPACFPTVRLAQLAMVVHSTENMLSTIINSPSLSIVRQLIDVTANDYWHYHFLLDEEAAFQPKKTGEHMINTIVMNTFIPLLYTYGFYHGEMCYQEKAIDWAMQLPAESNSIVNNFRRLGVKVRNGGDSQGVIELKSRYCNDRRCLECAVGNVLIRGR